MRTVITSPLPAFAPPQGNPVRVGSAADIAADLKVNLEESSSPSPIRPRFETLPRDKQCQGQCDADEFFEFVHPEILLKLSANKNAE
jgi:hypothetical protein